VHLICHLNMRTITFQAAASIVIATLTTVITTAVTSYLLARPWCIQLESDLHQRIVYGSSNCAPSDSFLQKRHVAKEGSDSDSYLDYQ